MPSTRRRTTEVQGTLGGMVLPGGSEHTAPDDLRQLAGHDAARITVPGGGRTSVLGPVVVYATADGVTGYR